MANDLVSYDEAWADEAKESASKEKLTTGGRFISHRSGQFTIGDDMEFPELCVVVLASAYENTWYDAKFDPNNLQPPKCFAIAVDEAELGAHPATYEHEAFEPQSESCKICPKAQWPKKGEATRPECRNMRRLLLLPVGQYLKRKGSRDLDLDMFLGDDAEENAELVRDGDSYLMKIPPTALRPYKELVHTLQTEYSRPPHGIILRIYTEPLRSGGHTVKFEPLGTLPDDLYPHIKERREAESDLLLKPYMPPQEEEAPF